ncbi:MAG: hypothetical protein HY791_16800 [Deltaproteobacteria bacterium]|nr:hypothetical protein [Deltaproteobacteria bacterium]
MILLILSDEASSARVLDLRTLQGAALGSTPVGAEFRAYALFYDAPLDELRLTEGAFEARREGRSIPQSAAVTLISESLDSGWRELPQIPAEVQTLHFDWPEAPARCVALDMSCVSLPVEAGVIELAVPIEGDRLLVALDSGRFFDVSPGGVTELVVPAEIPHRAGATVFGPRGEEIWLVGADRSVVSGTFDELRIGESQKHESLPWEPSERLWLDGSRDGAAVEMFAFSLTSSAAKFEEGAGWTSFYSDGLFGDTSGFCPALGFVGSSRRRSDFSVGAPPGRLQPRRIESAPEQPAGRNGRPDSDPWAGSRGRYGRRSRSHLPA